MGSPARQTRGSDMYRAEPDVNRRLAGGEKVDQRARRLVGVRLIVKREIRLLDVRAPLRRLGQPTGRPQKVRPS